MSDIFNSNINEIHISRSNLVKQLKAGGYNVVNYEGTSFNEIYYMNINNELDFKVNNNNGQIIRVKYFIGKPIKVNTLQGIMLELFDEDGFDPSINVIIIIVDNEPNAGVHDAVKQIYAEENVSFIIYNMKRLLFNIQEHKMVPKHRVLTNNEQNAFLEKYFITNSKNELPTISRFDPVALSIFIKPGQICEITRSSINGINSLYYRLCVNS